MEKQKIDTNQMLITLKKEMMRFMLTYKFALEEINTKIDILTQEFQYFHDYNPIEHAKSRLKSPESILKKVERKGYDFTLNSIQENIRDIAGVRITCSFITDIYEIKNMLAKQKDITIIECKDYIKDPKPNGYQSMHLIVQIPVFMSDGEEKVFVEIQIRTIAMDFWASLEHKIYYKYDKEIPEQMKIELSEAAVTAAQLDRKMESIHLEMNKLKELSKEEGNPEELLIQNERFRLPAKFLNMKKIFEEEGT
ncbi:GTP pyrophosphokinase [Cytobacillus purgationiresistens]|uniref:GTP pyrophosphokinase n=1 Tax=Cytobacillus purgationiresistens TaxID=863449 RepID=A0ABU0APE5_9BACI|nr:GTP pyrophosphokinase family protein [Cytobacillus purgationiresistens]MDQ0273163.1 putative GTP pyrophosphokinase [Cytobacillus purgationiresistens]